MKKTLSIIAILAFSLVLLTACGEKKEENNIIRIGVSPDPHQRIIETIKDDLEKDGVKIEIIPYDNYELINKALIEGDINANYFQHIPYLEAFNEESKEQIEILCSVHIEPMGIYSTKISSLDELEDGDEVMIPNDTTNCARALLLLENNGLIKIAEGKGLKATEKDVVENPKNLKFTALDAATIPHAYADAKIAAINGNFALANGLNPVKDSIIIEDERSYYVNVVAVKKGEKDKEQFQKLEKILHTETVREFIEKTYDGAVIPTF